MIKEWLQKEGENEEKHKNDRNKDANKGKRERR